MSRPRVVLTQNWPPALEREMAARYDLRILPGRLPPPVEAILAGCGGAEVLCPTFADRLPGELIAGLPPTIRLIASLGVGTNHIDIAAAAARGILVANTPDVVTADTADLTFGLIIAACRRFPEGDSLVRSGQWSGVGLFNLLGERVSGKTLGIVGLGRIGEAVAKRARGFDMKVLYYGPREKRRAAARIGARFCPSLGALLAAADIVSLHCPLTAATRGLIDDAALARMKPTGVLINSSRGPLVVEGALVRALTAGRIAAAGLDVFEFEPRVRAALRACPNAVLLPHVGTATLEGRLEMGRRVIANIEAYLATGSPGDPVQGPRGTPGICENDLKN